MTSAADRHRWTAALVAFDFDDTAPLAALIAGEAIPVELRPIVANIVTGARQPNRRAAAKAKVPAAERHQIGATLDALLVTIGDMRHADVTGPWADDRQSDPRDAIHRLNEQTDRTYREAAARLGISRETVENIVREYRQKAQNWPNV